MVVNMMKRCAVLPVLALLFVLPGCWFGGKEQAKLQGLVVINVLDKAVYDDCHIRGSINVPFEQIKDYAQEHINKDAEIVLYCSNYMCSASGYARQQLVNTGFHNVFVYEGGTAEWFQRGYPLDGPARQPYLQRVMQAPPAQTYVLDAQTLKQKIEARDAH
jgi:rhodanese-related sulfurtransferase